MSTSERQSLYGDVTSRIIAELEAGRLPWVQPWDKAKCPCTMPANAVSQRPYFGINVLILRSAAIEQGFASQRWLTFRQAMAAGGHVRRGEKGTVVCYADRFVPRAERDRAQEAGSDARTIAFLKRFTVFNLDQCEDLPEDLSTSPLRWCRTRASRPRGWRPTCGHATRLCGRWLTQRRRVMSPRLCSCSAAN